MRKENNVLRFCSDVCPFWSLYYGEKGINYIIYQVNAWVRVRVRIVLLVINLGMINIISDLFYYPGLFEGISS